MVTEIRYLSKTISERKFKEISEDFPWKKLIRNSPPHHSKNNSYFYYKTNPASSPHSNINSVEHLPSKNKNLHTNSFLYKKDTFSSIMPLNTYNSNKNQLNSRPSAKKSLIFDQENSEIRRNKDANTKCVLNSIHKLNKNIYKSVCGFNNSLCKPKISNEIFCTPVVKKSSEINNWSSERKSQVKTVNNSSRNIYFDTITKFSINADYNTQISEKYKETQNIKRFLNKRMKNYKTANNCKSFCSPYHYKQAISINEQRKWVFNPESKITIVKAHLILTKKNS